MEEQQIRDLVHRISSDETLRQELEQDPQAFVQREGVSSAVARVIMKLVPKLTLVNTAHDTESWW
ncbi:MAG TPA: hypothetical protein DHW02_23585 [Ktedonobacter sp.]|nr:hypothetical protein [Ktedonobacter sp.]